MAEEVGSGTGAESSQETAGTGRAGENPVQGTPDADAAGHIPGATEADTPEHAAGAPEGEPAAEISGADAAEQAAAPEAAAPEQTAQTPESQAPTRAAAAFEAETVVRPVAAPGPTVPPGATAGVPVVQLGLPGAQGAAEPAQGAPVALSSSAGGLDRRKALLIGGAGVVVVGGAVAAFAASGGSGNSSPAASGSLGKPGGGATAGTSPAAAPAATITTTPTDGSSDVDPSKPITVTVLNGTIESVQLSGTDQTNGTLSNNGTTWTCSNALNVSTSYQLAVVAKNSAGKTTSSTVKFQTLTPSAAFGIQEVVPPRGSTVGVGQPIRVTFTNYVPQEYQSALEQACVVNTTPPVAGAWYWVSNSESGAMLDWRPEQYWATNTQVSVDFNLNGVRLGEHQYGVENYSPHDFTISNRDLRLIVDKDKFQATCYQNGQVIRTFPIDTGQTTRSIFVTYTGTMAVLGKGNPVEMKGNYGGGDVYDEEVSWATQITYSGTYVHAAPWDSEIGYANDDSHGCIHCKTDDAEWFYNQVIDGDVVQVNGSLAKPVAVDNGICTFSLDWPTLLKGSSYGATINGKPASA